MANWLLVSRDWLRTVVSVVFRDVWMTSEAHSIYILRICTPPKNSFICELAGITDVRRHLVQICRSLTISVYHSYEGECAAQCADLIEYATIEPRRKHLLPGTFRHENPVYAIPSDSIATVTRHFIPRITSLHFVLIDCATYRKWDTSPGLNPYMKTTYFPLSRRPTRHLRLHFSAVPALVRCTARRLLSSTSAL
ncbi:hypothetical protein B0H19DRAFT_1267845 [Mycena capillaripes]|nr:hypothetical protein B0H19DRAFT_1267845 [Mycena capillaripes]